MPIHPICHSALHKRFTNVALAKLGDDVGSIRADADIAKFLGWIANKDPDFHAPTHRRSR